MERKIIYSEPADYFPEAIRKRHKLGEYAEQIPGEKTITEAAEPSFFKYLDSSGNIQANAPESEKRAFKAWKRNNPMKVSIAQLQQQSGGNSSPDSHQDTKHSERESQRTKAKLI